MSATAKSMADAIRVLTMDAVNKARSGHQGMPLGMADVATALWTRFLKYDASQPLWPDRDRFVLSAGHGSMLLYSLLHLTGFKAMTMAEIENFRQWGSKTPGHPEYGHTLGVETTPPGRWARASPPLPAWPWPSGIPAARASATSWSITAPG